MKPPRSLLLLIAVLAFFGSLFAAPGAAEADVIDMLARISDLANKGGGSFPTYQQIQDARGLIQHVVQGGDPLEYLSNQGGDTGNQYIDTIITLAKLYKAIDDSAIDEIISIVGQWLGDDAPCIIVDILTGGAGGSLCDLIKEIVEIASKAVSAVWDFLMDLGGAVAEGVKLVVEGLKGLGCALAVCCCDDEGGSPPYALAYALHFQPRVADGVAWREDVDANKFNQELNHLKNYANANAKSGGIAWYSPPDTDQAAAIFKTVVDTAWSADILKLPDGNLWALEKKRGLYFNDPAIMRNLAEEAVQQNQPGTWIWNRCIDDFSVKYGYAHIDRWKSSTFQDGNIKAAQQKVASNRTWCSNTYEYKHRFKEFKTLFSDYVDKSLCPKTDQNFFCPSDDKLASCRRIMNAISWEDMQHCSLKPPCAPAGKGFQCASLSDYKACVAILQTGKANPALCGIGFDASAAGIEVAKQIDAYFKANGSQFPCQFGVFDFSKSGMGSKAVDFICSRPVQQNQCNLKYEQLMGNTAPYRFVNCVLAEPENYKKLRTRVALIAALIKGGHYGNLHQHIPVSLGDQKAKAAAGRTGVVNSGKAKPGSVSVASQVSLHLPCDNTVSIPGPDPLVIHAEKCVVDRIKNDPNQDFGFGPPSGKPGFDYDMLKINPIDGAATPALKEVAGKTTIDRSIIDNNLKDKKNTIPESKLQPGQGGILVNPIDRKSVPMNRKITAPSGAAPGTQLKK